MTAWSKTWEGTAVGFQGVKAVVCCRGNRFEWAAEDNGERFDLGEEPTEEAAKAKASGLLSLSWVETYSRETRDGAHVLRVARQGTGWAWEVYRQKLFGPLPRLWAGVASSLEDAQTCADRAVAT